MRRLWACAAALALAGGCDEWKVEMETRIDAAGRLARETRIQHYKKGGHHSDGDYIGPKFRLPERASVVERTNCRVVLSIAARSPEEMQPDFVAIIDPRAGRPEPRNSVTWTARDCVLFEHWTYRERYSDSVDEAERDLATERLHAFVREVALEAVAAEADGRYDLSGLEAWLDGPARRLLHDVVRIATSAKDDGARRRRIAARLGAEGVAAGEKRDDAWDGFTAFYGERLRDLVRPVDGAAPFDPGDVEERMKGAAASLHGSTKRAEERFSEHLHAIVGDIAGWPVSFRARVALPGRLLRTNGYVDEAAREARVFWSFGTEDISVTGHALEVESIVERPEVLARPLDLDEVLRVLKVTKGLEPADAARLAEALKLLRHGATRDEVREGLADGLRGAFDALAEVAARRP